MKSIFDNDSRSELTSRINNLKSNAAPQWGKMTTYQMLKHCTLCEEMFQGEIAFKRLFAGRLFGRMVLNSLLKNADPIKKNQPTHPDLKITGDGNFEQEQSKWLILVNGYSNYSTDTFLHPFFGKMDKPQVGLYIYKHIDHHLKQFGA